MATIQHVLSVTRSKWTTTDITYSIKHTETTCFQTFVYQYGRAGCRDVTSHGFTFMVFSAGRQHINTHSQLKSEQYYGWLDVNGIIQNYLSLQIWAAAILDSEVDVVSSSSKLEFQPKTSVRKMSRFRLLKTNGVQHYFRCFFLFCSLNPKGNPIFLQTKLKLIWLLTTFLGCCLNDCFLFTSYQL